MKYAIGIDIGGTNIKAVSVTQTGEILEQRTYPTKVRGVFCAEFSTIWPRNSS